jgi:proline dehydrogenase
MLTRSALIYLSRQEGLKEFAARFSLFRKLTTRFIAGETIDEAIAAIREINAHGCTASFDHLNEGVTNAKATEAEVAEYLNVLARIDDTGIKSNVSIKLTQFGLEIDPELAYRNARRIVEDAKRRGNFVRVDMEGSNVTQATLDIFNRLRFRIRTERRRNRGAVLLVSDKGGCGFLAQDSGAHTTVQRCLQRAGGSRLSREKGHR